MYYNVFGAGGGEVYSFIVYFETPLRDYEGNVLNSVAFPVVAFPPQK
ncbi:MAG: hypothetical protein RDV41_05535 [Planctomycetota bacterium]|nr:hypothetical protein [Planctomycetota bacterium]